MAQEKAKSLITDNPVMVFSKSYCPFCKKVKELFSSMNVKHKVYELDQEQDGSQIQEALTQEYHQRTVPFVFVGGKLLGGADATIAANKSGELQKLLSEQQVTA
eukprot:SM000123S25815  [mRNA]  locus=s123:54828:55508:+ [translate_table: standard]